MKAALISFVLLPLLLIALTTITGGFRTARTLAASIAGEVLGLFLYAAYKQVKVVSILSGKASGSIMYVGTAAPRNLVKGLLEFAALGMLIGLVVLAGHRILNRVRSA
ncbi:MAG: hypothetical protein ACR2NS_03415 [Gemmatimonadaceae bacterium]